MTSVLTRRGNWDTNNIEKGDHVKVQRESGQLQAIERELGMKQPCQSAAILILDLTKCNKINSCCLSHLVCGILLQQPKQTKTRSKEKTEMVRDRQYLAHWGIPSLYSLSCLSSFLR